MDEIHQRRRNQQEELARQSLGQAQAGKAVAASAPSEVVRSEPAQREAVQASETEENADPDPFHDHPEGDDSSKSAEEALVMEGFETVKVARGKPLDRNEAENTGPYTAEQLRQRLS